MRLCDRHLGYVAIGFSIDGSEESPVIEDYVVEHFRKIEELASKSMVVAGLFSPIDRSSTKRIVFGRLVFLGLLNVRCSRVRL